MLPAVLQGMFGGIDLFARSLEARLGGMNDNAVAGLYPSLGLKWQSTSTHQGHLRRTWQ